MGFVVTPQDTLDYLNKVNTAVNSLEQDILTSAFARTRFSAAWSEWADQWREFYREHLPWYERLSGHVYDQTEQYELNLNAWREAFVKAGGKPTAPPSNPGSPFGFPVSQLTTLVVVAAAAWLAVKHL